MVKFEYKTFPFGEVLTQEQKDYFRKFGVIHFKNFINTDTIKTFIDELNKIEKKWLVEGIDKINGIPLKFGKDTQGNKMIQRMCFTNKHS